MLTEQQAAQFAADGYVIVSAFLNAEETPLLAEISRLDADLAASMKTRLDTLGGKASLSLDNDLHDDIYSAIVQSEKLVEPMAQILKDEPYHYHHKVSAKQPYEGGAWEWHQDYGYWYNNGCLWPHMASCYIAIDPATRENGCMQLISGSHLMGRVEHGKSGEQTGADMERVNAALDRMPLVYAEMAAGDALFFHSNTLHRSDQNRSPNPRWGLICCYNTKGNSPYKDGPHPRYTKMPTLPDSNILEVGRRQLAMLKSPSRE
jgi:ectoine hydroxylase